MNIDIVALKWILGVVLGNLAIILTLVIKLWAFFQKYTIHEYEHNIMWKRFSREHLASKD